MRVYHKWPVANPYHPSPCIYPFSLHISQETNRLLSGREKERYSRLLNALTYNIKHNSEFANFLFAFFFFDPLHLLIGKTISLNL